MPIDKDKKDAEPVKPAPSNVDADTNEVARRNLEKAAGFTISRVGDIKDDDAPEARDGSVNVNVPVGADPDEISPTFTPQYAEKQDADKKAEAAKKEAADKVAEQKAEPVKDSSNKLR